MCGGGVYVWLNWHIPVFWQEKGRRCLIKKIIWKIYCYPNFPTTYNVNSWCKTHNWGVQVVILFHSIIITSIFISLYFWSIFLFTFYWKTCFSVWHYNNISLQQKQYGFLHKKLLRHYSAKHLTDYITKSMRNRNLLKKPKRTKCWLAIWK